MLKPTLALLLALAVTSSADAGQRCRSTTMGSTTYTECDGPNGKTRCRASRSGTTTYTSCR
jgi:hypothetical protein